MNEPGSFIDALRYHPAARARAARSMEPGIHIEVRWFDVDVAQIRVRAWNGRFGGDATLYESRDFAAQLARKLRGFPGSVRDVREWRVGPDGPPDEWGELRFVFRCSDAAGHVVVDVALDSGSQYGSRGTASFEIELEVAAIDRFVDALARMPVETSASVFLPARVR